MNAFFYIARKSPIKNLFESLNTSISFQNKTQSFSYTVQFLFWPGYCFLNMLSSLQNNGIIISVSENKRSISVFIVYGTQEPLPSLGHYLTLKHVSSSHSGIPYDHFVIVLQIVHVILQTVSRRESMVMVERAVLLFSCFSDLYAL